MYATGFQRGWAGKMVKTTDRRVARGEGRERNVGRDKWERKRESTRGKKIGARGFAREGRSRRPVRLATEGAWGCIDPYQILS